VKLGELPTEMEVHDSGSSL